MRLEPTVSVDEIEQALRVMARDQFGADRAAVLDHRLSAYARMLALIAAEPVDFATDPPDCSGIDEADHGR